MVIVTDRQMDKYFGLCDSDSHYPEVHVVYRSDNDCACFIRSTNGEVYKLALITTNTANLETFLEGFRDLVVWYHSSLDALRGKLGF